MKWISLKEKGMGRRFSCQIERNRMGKGNVLDKVTEIISQQLN